MIIKKYYSDSPDKVHNYWIEGKRNPCGCGSNLFHYEYDGTDVSGRGVGMDVVRTKIEALNGSIEVLTEKDKGTEIKIKLPLTLAIIEALMVKLEEEIFAIPLANIVETIDIAESVLLELKKRGIRVIAEETGGNAGRTIELDLETGNLKILIRTKVILFVRYLWDTLHNKSINTMLNFNYKKLNIEFQLRSVPNLLKIRYGSINDYEIN